MLVFLWYHYKVDSCVPLLRGYKTGIEHIRITGGMSK